MEHIGMDVHKQESQICIWTDGGMIVEQRIRTSAERMTIALGNRPASWVLLEASTESEWVARCLEQLGHEVIVADPNFAPMYATRNRRIKTDRRDARALMDACRQGTYRRAHRLSDGQQRVRARLAARDSLVRVRLIGVMRALLRRQGLRLSSGSTETFADRVRAVDKPEWLQAVLEPLLEVLGPVARQIAQIDRSLRAQASEDPLVRRLCTAPGVGPVTAVAFVATLDDARRFHSAREVRSYLGLVPSENSSAELRHRGSISKRGNDRMRWLLVEAGWCVLRSTRVESESLRRWAAGIVGRRGRKIAVVALARRLAGILYAMWRDDRDFESGARGDENRRTAVAAHA